MHMTSLKFFRNFFSAELNGSRLRASVETQLQRTYPFLRENEYSLVDYLNSIMELLKLAFPEGQAPLMSIMNCRQLENFGDLQSFVLKSVISSSSASTYPSIQKDAHTFPFIRFFRDIFRSLTDSV